MNEGRVRDVVAINQLRPVGNLTGVICSGEACRV